MLLYGFREYFKTIFPIEKIRNRHDVDADEINYFTSYRLINFIIQRIWYIEPLYFEELNSLKIFVFKSPEGCRFKITRILIDEVKVQRKIVACLKYPAFRAISRGYTAIVNI